VSRRCDSREDVELVVDRVELEREADAVLVLAGEPVCLLDLEDVLVDRVISHLCKCAELACGYSSREVGRGASERRLTDGDGTARGAGSARGSHGLLEVLCGWQVRHVGHVRVWVKGKKSRAARHFELGPPILNFPIQSRIQTRMG
jgi:hypothetical protein